MWLIKSVSERLIKEAEKGDLFGKVGQVIVPIEKSFFLKNGKKVAREKVLFPGYIFIETNAIGELKYFLKVLTLIIINIPMTPATLCFIFQKINYSIKLNQLED